MLLTLATYLGIAFAFFAIGFFAASLFYESQTRDLVAEKHRLIRRIAALEKQIRLLTRR
jgi:hypothetical protein